MNNIEFEETLFKMRDDLYRHPRIDIIGQGFKPVSGKVADFAVAELGGRYHFFYIERRMTEGTPFFPGNEIYFGHASTPDFFDWEVHNPVMVIQPGTWEEAHMWAPCILKRGDTYVMAYTGLNYQISQNIGLAFSKDLFNWERYSGNPISPCKDADWACWREDRISSCRDPHIFEHDGRVWINYTANTKEGASCIALCSSKDLVHWEDHGPTVVGPAGGYEPRLEGGHKQGSLESTCILQRCGRWFMILKFKFGDSNTHNWLLESKSLTDRFDLEGRWEFWPGALGVEVVKDRGDRSLLCTFAGGYLRFGEVDWAQPKPTAQFIQSAEQLKSWQD